MPDLFTCYGIIVFYDDPLALSLTGLSFHDCYTKCREAFLVNSDATLRAQLTEFRDHKLIRSKKVSGITRLLFDVSFICMIIPSEQLTLVSKQLSAQVSAPEWAIQGFFKSIDSYITITALNNQLSVKKQSR